MAGKDYGIKVYRIGYTDAQKANLYLNTTLVKARARAIRDYGSDMKGGSQVEIRPFRTPLEQGRDSWIGYDGARGWFYYTSYHYDQLYRGYRKVKHVLKKDGTLGAIIYDERRR